MASPDVRQYVDLTLYDRTPAELVDRALIDAATKLPGWTPREGNTEVVVMEAVSLEDAELVFAVNRLPGAMTEVQARLFGLERDPGTLPTATATFTLADTAGHVIPAGTILRLTLDDGTSLTFTTDADLNVVAPAAAGTVAITGTDYTDSANGTAAGTDLSLISTITYVDSVELATDVADGANPEDSSTFLNRAVTRFSRLSEVLTLPEQFTARALEEANVYRATTLNNYDGVGANTSTDYGHVTVAVVGQNGALLSGPAKTAIEAELEDEAQVNLDVHVIDATINVVTITATVQRLGGYTDAEVKANVVAALEDYLSPDQWEWGGTVRLNELIALIDGADGVDYVTAVAIEGVAADFALTGVAPLVDTDTVAANITVTAP